MLYFLLVLGIVPGTNIRLSFSEVLIIAYILGMIFVWRLGLFTTSYHQSKELAAVKRRAARDLGLYDLTAVQLIGRTIVVPQERISRRPLYFRDQLAHQYERNTHLQRYLVRPDTISFA